MINKITEIFNKKLLTVVITVICVIGLFTLLVYSNKKSPKDEYFLSLRNILQNSKKEIPNLEEKLRNEKLKKRCIEKQFDLILNNKDYDLNYCDKKENLEEFSEKNKIDKQKDNVTSMGQKEISEEVSFLKAKKKLKNWM